MPGNKVAYSLLSSLPLSGLDARTRARARARSIGGREDVKSFHAQKISSLEHRAEIHSPKDVDLPTERMSPKKYQYLTGAGLVRAPALWRAVNRLFSGKTNLQWNVKLHQIFIILQSSNGGYLGRERFNPKCSRDGLYFQLRGNDNNIR